MTADIVRFVDYERRSREPDAAQPRNPCDATVIIILPVIHRNEGPGKRRRMGRVGPRSTEASSRRAAMQVPARPNC